MPAHKPEDFHIQQEGAFVSRAKTYGQTKSNHNDFKVALLRMPRDENKNKVSSLNTLLLPQKQISKYEKGIPKVSFSNEGIQQFSQELNFTLVGKFSYGYHALHVIKREFIKLNLTGDYFVGILNVRHIIIKLSNEQNYLKI